MNSEQTAADRWRPDTYWDGGGEGNFVEGYTRGIGSTPFAAPEALPEMEEGEIEIVLIKMRSTLGDMLSLRARRTEGGIVYRMVDEYDLSRELPSPHNDQPLTFGELTDMLKSFRMSDRDGLFFPSGWSNVMESLDREDTCEFYQIESDFYDGLHDWYLEQFEQWAAVNRAEWEEEDEG
jgi:hypothetical protein